MGFCKISMRKTTRCRSPRAAAGLPAAAVITHPKAGVIDGRRGAKIDILCAGGLLAGKLQEYRVDTSFSGVPERCRPADITQRDSA